MQYVSTRGNAPARTFTDVLLDGMAPDGGLYVPEHIPALNLTDLQHYAGTSYADLAVAVMRPFLGPDFPEADFSRIVQETYGPESGLFRHASVAPLVQIGPSTWLMELFHGPTLAFKDVALQLLGRLFDYVLERQNKRITIVAATSGDTGSAAIEACRYCERIDIFVLHPRGRVSEVQRRQMTTVKADGVHNIALEGTFDDCQALVKALFADKALRSDLNLSAVNSINWARIMAQAVYYVSASLALGGPTRPVSFAVPTGNFGNVYAAWLAKQMGLPIQELVIGTNRNDILTRFFETGEMRTEKVVPSLSPSMDIQISSNFERYLHNLMGGDSSGLSKLMTGFKKDGAFRLGNALHERTRKDFLSGRCSDSDTLSMIRACYEATGIVIDPHTAVGLFAAQNRHGDPSVPLVALACAHPAKFPDAVEKATGRRPPLPDFLESLYEKAEFSYSLPNDVSKLAQFVRQNSRAGK